MPSLPSRLLLTAISLLAIQTLVFAGPQEEIPRSIVSDDFVKNRPRAKGRRPKPKARVYRLTSSARTKQAEESDADVWQIGVTIWRLTPERNRQLERTARRVEVGTKARDGDLLRISIESPRAGYLYVVDRDWFIDGAAGETNLIFPVRGEDNRLKPGKLIDIPPQHEPPLKASPKPNQTGELLTIIVTLVPLQLPLSSDPLPITAKQLSDWEKRWRSVTDRYELNEGAGQTRTIQEYQAALLSGTRQLSRNDPGPQAIYRLVPQSRDGVLFNLMLSYVP